MAASSAAAVRALLRVALCVIAISCGVGGEAEPQLNLPQFAGPVSPTGRPLVLPNSYSSGPGQQQQQQDDSRKEGNNYDQSRSERFGPPYEGGDDDDEENYPQGRSNDERQDRQNRPFSYDDRNQYNNDYDYRNRNRNPYDRDRNRYVSDVDNPDLYQNRQPYNPNQGQDRFRNPDGRYNPNQRPYVSDVDNPDLYQDRNPYNQNPNDDRFDPNRRPQFGPPNERDFERGRPRDSFSRDRFAVPKRNGASEWRRKNFVPF
nr:probable serine/threonine-protein kinase clkA [Aedes albopictus]